MLEVFKVLQNAEIHTDLEVVLTFEERQKSRYKTTLADGNELGWFVERGIVLSDGDLLQCQSGEYVRVVAAPETVSQVESEDQLALTRVAYHLGNRHVPLQIGSGYLRYLHDHVLDDMVLGLGLSVHCKQLPFQPENGAYHGKQTLSHSHHHHEH
jgi:urease accessory protein